MAERRYLATIQRHQYVVLAHPRAVYVGKVLPLEGRYSVSTRVRSHSVWPQVSRGLLSYPERMAGWWMGVGRRRI